MPSVLITGGNRGLGFEFAKQYAADGWRVYPACRNPNNASDLRRLAETKEGLVEVLPIDVTDLASVRSAAAKLEGRAVDLLLNSAGIGGPRQTVGAIDYGAWARVLDVNTMGPTRVTEAFTDNVARSNRKLIVTITSGMGSRRFDRLPQLEGRSEHGDAQPRNRSRTARHQLRACQSRMGAH